MIRVAHLAKHYAGAAAPTLRDVSFEVPTGRLAAIVGRSGAGKSTLLRCLVGLEPFEAGAVEIEDLCARAEDGLRAAASLRGRVGLVPQTLDLFPHLSALDNCTLALRVARGEPRAAAEARATELLGRLGLAGELRAYPEQLSGGQRQRVAIARALAVRPRVLLYDEPTSALDPSLKEEVRRALATVRDAGVTQLVATHDVELARSAAWVIVLENGTIARQGEAARVLG
ncbi:MAG TPA: ATP-binding cassette domain-containing protein [Anaeromyxobacteraceae bacterium]|nr:ATP-binding cassette domain-containing protein [Anaeromyxobacteraceae bacterium]